MTKPTDAELIALFREARQKHENVRAAVIGDVLSDRLEQRSRELAGVRTLLREVRIELADIAMSATLEQAQCIADSLLASLPDKDGGM